MSEEYQPPPPQSNEQVGPPLTEHQRVMGAMIVRLATASGLGRIVFIPNTEFDNIRGFRCRKASTPQDGDGLEFEAFTTSEIAHKLSKKEEDAE